MYVCVCVFLHYAFFLSSSHKDLLTGFRKGKGMRKGEGGGRERDRQADRH